MLYNNNARGAPPQGGLESDVSTSTQPRRAFSRLQRTAVHDNLIMLTSDWNIKGYSHADFRCYASILVLVMRAAYPKKPCPNYEYALGKLEELYPDLPTSPSDINDFLIANDDLADESIHGLLRRLKTFFRWVESEGIGRDVMANFPLLSSVSDCGRF